MAMDPSDPTAADERARERIRGLRSGDSKAVDAWFRSEHPAVYRLCFGFLADADEAEDVAQDAMLHLLDKLDGAERTWDERRPYGVWRDTVVLNLCRDRLRRVGARGRAHAAAVDARPDDYAVAPDPHRELERREVRALLTEALRALTPREREVFVLRDLEGRSTEETAGSLAIGKSTVRSILTLARRRLRDVLGERLIAPEGGELA